MRHLPTSSYSGLTIVMSQASRFDDKMLLSGAAGYWFSHEVLAPNNLNRYACDIRTADTYGSGILPNTRCILLLGEPALHRGEWCSSIYKDYKLGEQRGYPLDTNTGIATLASYLPQDCMDIKDYESKFNTELNVTQDDSEHGEEKEGDAKRRHGITARSNFRFWLKRDVHKSATVLRNRGCYPSLAERPTYNIYPEAGHIIDALGKTKNKDFFLDIETSIEDKTLSCFGFAFGDGPIYVVPVYRYNGSLAYSNIYEIFRALIIAMRDNCIVVHNSSFDLFVLAWLYKLPFGRRIYDTLLAQHRCFPEAEKSLGHCMSLWCYEYYHKDEGIFAAHNQEQERRLWEYNGKDIHGMRLVKQEQLRYAQRDPGLMASIEQANDMIYTYLVNTLYGIEVDDVRRLSLLKRNDRYLTQLHRIIRILTGEDLLPTSTKAMPRYFHEKLGYKIVGRTKTGNARLDEKALLKLKLAHPDNVLIDTCIRYRETVKESGSMKFEPLLIT